MKKTLLVIALSAGSVLPAMSQLAGLPVAGDAVSRPGLMQASGGIVLGDHLNLYGGRVGFGLSPAMKVFGDLGLVDPDRGDTGWGIQGGGIFALPLQNLAFDLAARGTIGYASMDQKNRYFKMDVDILSFNAGVLASTQIEAFSLYGYLGLAHVRTTASHRGRSHTHSETDPALGIGGIIPVTHNVSLFAELMHIDKAWFGFGALVDL